MRSVNGSVHASHGASAAWPLSAIRIGPRARRQLGNLQPLMASIAAVGLLHPVVIRPDGTLLAGQRRLEACRALGYTAVPVHIVDTEAVLRAEHDENTVRLDFLPSELVAIAEALWHHEAAEAYQRMLAGTPSGKFPEGVTGETRNKVAQYVGVSGRTLEKATAIVRAAREHPEKYQRLVDQMDQHGKVDPAYKMLKVARAHERTAAKARQAQEQMAAEAQAHFASVCDIRQCSMQELLTSGIHPDVIITDPPYAESHLSLYGELARLATHVPTVATLCGCMFCPIF
jgi:ParB-like chromosome segregation protein Spo0J